MGFLEISRITAIAGLILGLVGVLFRLGEILRRPLKKDRSRDRGSRLRGVLFAFTLGMAPWEKESTRMHWIAYLRGIFFHIGVFTAFGVLALSAWIEVLPAWLIWTLGAVTGVGALFGFAGIAMRLAGVNERVLSLPDDYFAVFLSSLFALLACASLFYVPILPYFYLLTAVLAVYIPIGKIRHCIYFFYSKFFFGAGFGHRGVIGQPEGETIR